MRFRPILPLSSSISLTAATHRLPPMSFAACAPIPVLALPRTSRNGAQISLRRGFTRSRVSMTASVVSQASVAVEDSLFKDYQPTHAFFFPGQGIGSFRTGEVRGSVHNVRSSSYSEYTWVTTWSFTTPKDGSSRGGTANSEKFAVYHKTCVLKGPMIKIEIRDISELLEIWAKHAG